ncbi:substrate-binding domain-containing protein [Sulfitobacter sp. F26204]|uniref:substrate-binding domain-containing protein n=1 Tax=Sulfitobacter sp. F26204 TaxID=2996014 RepID=UPI00225E6FA5|nr:substrate-binding domain-containing protein [Sulfitobacter sp. F26204]MCX7560170.1 substrate-binding domain-containing protein [Sulfitobacter sp. F26204]
MIRVLALVACLFGATANAETMKLAVTTSFHNSGLSDVLLPILFQETGLEVQLLVVGTGQALRLGEAGDVDAILVHSRSAEDAFIARGFAPYRREIMYNDFVFVGPQNDPAGIRQADDAIDALQHIALHKPNFVSRGDDSGTHKKERALWLAASLDPDHFGTWYKAVGSGMGASLNTATGLNAYILSDRASWLKFGNKGSLALLFSGDPVLFNQYAYLPIDPQRHPHVKAEASQRLENWLTGPTAERLINDYRINGEALFIFNAQK